MPNLLVSCRSCSVLAAEQDLMVKLLDLANASTEADFLAGRVQLEEVHFVHKYAEPVPVSIKVRMSTGFFFHCSDVCAAVAWT